MLTDEIIEKIIEQSYLTKEQIIADLNNQAISNNSILNQCFQNSIKIKYKNTNYNIFSYNLYQEHYKNQKLTQNLVITETNNFIFLKDICGIFSKHAEDIGKIGKNLIDYRQNIDLSTINKATLNAFKVQFALSFEQLVKYYLKEWIQIANQREDIFEDNSFLYNKLQLILYKRDFCYNNKKYIQFKFFSYYYSGNLPEIITTQENFDNFSELCEALQHSLYALIDPSNFKKYQENITAF